MRVGAQGGGNHRFGVHLVQARDVVRHAAVEQLDVLGHVADVGAQFFARPVRHVGAVQADLAAAGAPHAREHAREGRLAGRARADDGQGLARRQREDDVREHQGLRAGRAVRDVLRAQASFGARHGDMRLGALEVLRQFLQAPVGRPRFDQRAPAAHELLHRLHRPAQQDAGGDHHAGGSLLAQHQVRAQGQHENLDGLARGLGPGGERHGAAAGAGLHGRDLVLQRPPAHQQALCHSQGLQHFGVAQGTLDVLRGASSFVLQGFERPAADAVVEPGQAEHEERGERSAHAERGVEHPDHEHVHEHPGRIEHRDQTIGGKHGAKRGHVPDSFCPHAARGACGALHDGVHHRWGESLVHHDAHHVLQPGSQVVQQQQDEQRHAGPGEQHQQRFMAAGRDDPVEHLQGEERGHQEQQVDEEGERRDVQQQRSQFHPQGFHVRLLWFCGALLS
ncbi:hypothetical protein D9M68_427430 [compost metagenome]